MKDGLIRMLKKWPGGYNFAEAIYSRARLVLYFFKGTKPDEDYWAKRHLNNRESKKDDWSDARKDWIESYWGSTQHPHRKFLIGKIAAFEPGSILEIGCNCGPNLRLLAEKFPHAELIGIDINPVAIQKGNEWFSQAGIKNVRLIHCRADELEQFKDKHFDVVFTDAVLIYFGPDKIRKVISEMLRISRKSLVLMEWNDFSTQGDPLGKYKKHWVRDYEGLLKSFVPETEIKTEKLPEGLWDDKNWNSYGALIEVLTENKLIGNI